MRRNIRTGLDDAVKKHKEGDVLAKYMVSKFVVDGTVPFHALKF